MSIYASIFTDSKFTRNGRRYPLRIPLTAGRAQCPICYETIYVRKDVRESIVQHATREVQHRPPCSAHLFTMFEFGNYIEQIMERFTEPSKEAVAQQRVRAWSKLFRKK